MSYKFRSNDVFYWFPYDIVWFSLVMQSIYIDLLQYYPDLKLWEMYHNAWSIHYYEEFYDKVDKIINKSVIKTKKLELRKSLFLLKELDIKKYIEQALRNKNKWQLFFKRKLLNLIW